MGEWVKASQIRIGDYVSLFGPGYLDRKVLDITGDLHRGKTGDGPWEDRRVITIRMGNGYNPNSRDAISGRPDMKVWRTHKRPTVIVADDDSVHVNGIPSGRIVLEADVKAWEYSQEETRRSRKGDEIIGGPTGYAWKSYHVDGTELGTATSYEACLDGLVLRALWDQEKGRQAAAERLASELNSF